MYIFLFLLSEAVLFSLAHVSRENLNLILPKLNSCITPPTRRSFAYVHVCGKFTSGNVFILGVREKALALITPSTLFLVARLLIEVMTIPLTLQSALCSIITSSFILLGYTCFWVNWNNMRVLIINFFSSLDTLLFTFFVSHTWREICVENYLTEWEHIILSRSHFF